MRRKVLCLLLTTMLPLLATQMAMAQCEHNSDPASVQGSQFDLQAGIPTASVIVATMSLCQQCTIQGFAARVVWSDNTPDAHPSLPAPGTNTLIATHTYVQANPSGYPIKVEMGGHCVNSQRNYDDRCVIGWPCNVPGIARVHPSLPPIIVDLVRGVPPQQVVAGSKVYKDLGLVTIDRLATAPGMMLKLSSNNAEIVIPPLVTIPPGVTAATFDITTVNAVRGRQIQISAECAGTQGPECHENGTGPLIQRSVSITVR
jgi:hypothetical protein